MLQRICWRKLRYLMLFIKAAANTATQMKYTEAANNLIYDVMGQENVDYLGLSVEDNDWFAAANNYGNMLNVAGTEIEAEAMRFCTDKVFWEKLVGTGVSSAAGISGGVWTLSLEAARFLTALFPLTGSLVDAYEAERRALLLSDVQQCVYMVADATKQRISIQRTDTELYSKYIQAQQMYCRTSIAMYENLITMVNEFGQDKEYWTSFFQARIDKLAVSLYQLTTIQGDGVNKCLPMELESFVLQSEPHYQEIKFSKEEQYKVNIFLSNFSEQWFHEIYIWDDVKKERILVADKFEVLSADVMELVKFAWLYAKINMNAVKLLSHGGHSYYGVDIDVISSISERFFGRTIYPEDIQTGTL